MSFGASMAGFASGLNGGLATGQRLNQLVEEDKIARVRAQGIAEAQAMQAAAAPKVQDNGDMQNLTSNPQMSRDPNAAPEPVNTSLQQFQNNAQAQGDGGPVGVPVAPPQVQDTNKLSSVPLASAAPSAQAEAPAPSPFANGLPQVARKRFNVDGQEFDSKDEADAYAKGKTPPVSDFYAKTLVPKMKERLLAMGKIEEADRWEQYASSEKSRKYGETWLNAVKKAHMEDWDGAASELIKLHPEFADGYDLISAEKAKGDDGTTGFNMRVRAPDGTVKEMYQNSRTLVELGAPQLSPIEAFKKMDAKQTAADTLQAKEVIDQRNDARTADRQLANEKARDAAAEKRQQTKIDADKKRDEVNNTARMERAREGWSAAAKRDAAKIASEGQFRKAVSPEERQAIVVSGLAKDPMFGMLSPEEKKQRVADTMALIPSPKQANPVADPKAQGLPTTSAVPAGKKAVPVFNPATGKVETVYR